MRFKFFPLFVVIFVCVISAAAQTVVESESSLVINEKTVRVSLVVDSKVASGRKIALEILDSDEKVRTSFDQIAKLRSGRQTLSISMPIGDLMKKSDDEVAWFRLKYKVGDMTGIISLSELLKEDFELRAAVPRDVLSGVDYRVRLHAINPFAKRNIRKVVIEGTLTLELNTDAKNDKLIVKAAATTGSDGLAVLNFKIPEGAKLNDDGEVIVVGRKDGIVREIKEDLDTNENKGSVFLTADKPIYQPGQDFRVRGLFFDANHTVVSGNELEFTIKDEDDSVLYREKVKTSEYGVASITWKVPENAKLGDYRVEVEADDDLEQNAIPFKVSRYDLPAFSVSAAPNKSFYLMSDGRAEIAISADYLFGKPVTKGKVKLVEQDERKWNWREQKYEVEESWSTEGAADANGKYVAEFDLADEFQRLNAKSWQRFEDLHFAAYFTDLTTNRTEQRRFDIRLSKEPIHVYLFINSRNSVNLPITGYVSTFYADGTPAICNVAINGKGTLSQRFKTNDLGAGKFSFDIPAGSLSDRRYDFKINARDKRGQIGTMDEDLYLDADDVIQIETDQTIYKPGDPITLKVSSTRQRGLVYVDVVKDSAIIGAYSINMRNGRAEIQIPFQPIFKGELTIGAYTDLNTSYWDDTMRASRGVVFPERQNLSLGAKFSSASYHPGEDASVKFSILNGGGRSTESALGIVVFDKAVEERAKTDAGFGRYFSRYDSLMGYQKSFGNLSLKDLNDLDTSKPIPPETQLAAEIMLAGNYYYPRIYHSGDSETEASDVYADFFRKQLAPVNLALNDQYAKNRSFANDRAELEEILARYNIKFSDLVDPWGQQYQVVISTDRTYGSVTLRSNGADKKPGTADDFDVVTNRFQYFVSTGSLIDKAVNDYHVRTGGYIRDIDHLKAELALSGFDLGKMKDRWGRDYQIKFDVSGRDYVIKISSLGANGVLETNRAGDDFDVWSSYIDYFLETESDINLLLSKSVNYGKKPFPKTNDEFSELLRQNGLDMKSVKDGYGQPIYLTSTVEAQYSDKTVIENGKTKIVPVTNQMRVFTIRSFGADAINGADDMDLARFSTILTEHFAGPMSSQAEVRSLAYSGSRGAIRGTVTDPNGAVVPNANITATDQDDPTKTYNTVSGEDGQFLLQNLPTGRYSIEAVSAGFQRFKYENVFVRSMNLIEINITLHVGAATATVDVTATADINQTSNASISKTVTTVKGLGRITFGYPDQTSTPRLRNYFPETLLWNPELITDKKGKAELKFKLADNITTWKMYAIASTKNGKIGVAEKEVTAFQPFFVDLDPPKFLTEGDEIYLPSQVRNYTDKQQKVDVTMSKSEWFSMLGSEKQQIDVKAGDSQNAVFGFKATESVKDGKQRVTAIADSDSDAIEKPVTVRPNGQEVVHTDSNLFTGEEKVNLTFPANALPKTQKAELKIYPNLYSHVAESVEGLLERPYGCGEQTISSTYPNLMVLKFVKPDSALAAKAKRYLQKGYERLLGYQGSDGGFTYWGGKSSSDIALTAYAIRFLSDAGSNIDVDPNVIKKAQEWLIKQQRADGSWLSKQYWQTTEDPSTAKLTTTYVARSLAMQMARAVSPVVAGGAVQGDALTRALAFLKTRNAEIDEPYALALFGLASLDAGDTQTADSVAKLLESMAIAEGSSDYWKLETNTPFYGWGTAGRIETTALVTQLLIRTNQNDPNAQRQDLINKATLFLLKNKDRYGVWYSTQTTINVLDAFIAAIGTQNSMEPQRLDVRVNGEPFKTVEVAPDRIEAVTLELTGKVNIPNNNIEIRSSGNFPVMSQLVASHYINWKDSDASNTNVNQSRALSLNYKCDKTNAAIMEEVNCSVKAERIGFKGYGMLLAEIGTPPGADVSRESLEKAIESDWSISHYEILPDRIVVYMWSKAGGTNFNFKFHPRYGINAQTPASIVYDYYNPEAQAIVAPLRFLVK